MYANHPVVDREVDTLGSVLSPLVIEADGLVVPLQYGFPRRYALGSLNTERLTILAERWMEAGHRDFFGLCNEAYLEEVSGRGGKVAFNWYERLDEYASK